MHRVLRRITLAVAIMFLVFPHPLLAVASMDALVLGVFPYISASQMMDQLSPLIKRIENTLGKEIVMVSAPDFNSFVERTSKGEYDMSSNGITRKYRLLSSGCAIYTATLVKKRFIVISAAVAQAFLRTQKMSL